MMFINSIFLPKTISDQSMPTGISGTMGNFSHLFSNVFRIVKDDQESPAPFQLADITSEAASNTQNELLNVSLLSDSKINLDNQNISMIVTSFLSKLNSGGLAESLTDKDTVKVDAKIPKYFSLSKNDFIKQIKSIIDTLKNGDLKSLENVEISLIANGQSIKINPLTTNVADLENWVTEQFKSNPDFEILVKSDHKKLPVQIEQIKTETIQLNKPDEIISVVSDKSIESETKLIPVKNVVEPVTLLKNNTTEDSANQQPIIGPKQTYTSAIGDILKPENPTLQNLGNPVHANDLQPSQTKNICGKESIASELNNPGKAGVEPHSQIFGKIKPELNQGIKSNSTNTKNVETKNIADSTPVLKNKIDSETHNEVIPKPEVVKQYSEVNVNNGSHSDIKISVKSNHKINLVSLNKNDIKEKVILNELIGKTDVKNIEVNIQKSTKAIYVSAPKIQDEYQQNLTSLKENIFKIQSPGFITEVKKTSLINHELKQPTSNKVNESENIKVEIGKSEKPVSITIEENTRVTKTELSSKVISGNEKSISSKNELAGIQKINLSTTDLPKSNTGNQQTQNENVGIDPSEKIKSDKNYVDQNKTVLNDNKKSKFETIGNPSSKRIVPPETKSELQTVDLKRNSQINENKKLEVDPNNYSKSVTKENVKEPVVPKSNVQLVDDNSTELFSHKTVKEIVKENVKATIATKSNSAPINKAFEKSESISTFKTEIALSNNKEKTIVENLRTGLKEFVSDEVKQKSINLNQKNNKTLKIDFIQRRVYSQIPHLEVVSDEVESQKVKDSGLNIESNKDESIQSIDEPVKSTANIIEQKPKNEKQVWVKVSLEKNENEVAVDNKKSSLSQNKITIDTAHDGMKKEFDQNNYSEKDARENPKQKSQAIQIETSQNTEVKTANQNQNTSNHLDSTIGIKSEIKTDNIPVKSQLHSEEPKFSSRTTEMIERIKVISSGEMIREITKVFESGEKQSIVLRLVPKELGSVKIMLDTIDNVLTAKVEVENETVGHIVRNNVDQLKQNLLQNGVHVNSINISYHNSDQKQQGFNNQKRKNSGYLHEKNFEEVDETIVSKKMGYNTYEFLA